MKHAWSVTLIFLMIFLTAQVTGLLLISKSTNVSKNEKGQVKINSFQEAILERPQIQGFDAVIYIVTGMLIGTIALLFFAKTKSVMLWRLFFIFVVWSTMIISLEVIFEGLILLPILLSAVITYFKVYKSNVFVHNISEILIYSGIAVILVPGLNVPYAALILLLVSIYDVYAVWKSKHMITIAKFTTDANLFPGLSIPYSIKKQKTILHTKFEKKELSKDLTFKKTSEKPNSDNSNASNKSDNKTSILGGGDVVFPLIFAGVVMLDLLKKGFSKEVAFFLSLIVIFGALLSLVYLFVFAKENKFYPAMPYLTTGCFFGYGLIFLVIHLTYFY